MDLHELYEGMMVRNESGDIKKSPKSRINMSLFKMIWLKLAKLIWLRLAKVIYWGTGLIKRDDFLLALEKALEEEKLNNKKTAEK